MLCEQLYIWVIWPQFTCQVSIWHPRDIVELVWDPRGQAHRVALEDQDLDLDELQTFCVKIKSSSSSPVNQNKNNATLLLLEG